MDRLVQLFADIAKLWQGYGASYLTGMRNTLVLALIGTLIGCIIGFICGVLNTIPYTKRDSLAKRGVLGFIRGLVRVYVEVFRGTPMVLQAVFLYYGLPYFTNNTVRFTDIWSAAILVVSINTGAYMAESVRGGIISIDPGQAEGAKAIGMNHWQTMTNVILPQALRNILPQIGNNFIINVKDTSVMFIIGFPDFFAAHRAAVGASYLYFPSATVEMAAYLTMTLVASFLLRWVEKRLDGADSYELVNADPLVMTAGTYSHPHKGSPTDEYSKEFRENLKNAMKNRNFDKRGER
ncbi:MAG: amino acid ABC transporter permease [Oscillospiraceae bacterium]|nr:amino acid ABC transporter permease [Oscillospiraceae bacterium]